MLFRLFVYSFLLLTSTFVMANVPTVLISIDGFANEYLEEFKPINLTKFAKQGVVAKALIPVFPSKTFPNHLSMVTGVYPEDHGIMHNRFFNKELKENYKLGAGKKEPQWLTAMPIWSFAEKQNLKTGIYFWPESEVEIGQHKPSYNFSYKHSTPNKTRVNQIIEWLRMDEKQRPALILSYFSTVDSAGHHYGRKSKELKYAIQEIDLLIGKLITTIDNEFLGLVNVVIVSDHGMVNVNRQEIIAIPKPLKTTKLTIINGETQLYLYGDDTNNLNDTRSQLLKHVRLHPSKKYKVFSKGNYPKHWHFDKNSPVMPDMILNAEPPFVFENKKGQYNAGTHGYDPLNNSALASIFMAKGPAFSKGEIPAFENIHVFALIAHLLNIDVPSHYPSTLSPFHAVLKKQ